MEPSNAGTVPTVLLSCFSAAKRSVLVTESFARDYEKLVYLAYHRYGKEYPQVTYDVHFHHKYEHIIDDRQCEAEIDDLLFGLGEYFDAHYMQQGRLRLFAHFVPKSPDRVQQEIKIAEFSDFEEGGSGSLVVTDYEEVIEEEDDAEPQRRKSRTQDLPRQITAGPDEGDTVSAHKDTIRQARKRRARTLDLSLISEERPWQRARVMSTASQYPSISSAATAQKFLQDLEALVTSGPPLDSMHNKRKLKVENVKEKRVIAHAMMIETDGYGVDAIEPCSACVANGDHCRVYYPDMQKYPWRTGLGKNLNRGVGTSCATCRSHVWRGCDAA